MFELLTDCSHCIYGNFCRNVDNAKIAMDKIRNSMYGIGPNNDYTWNDMVAHLNVDIKFSCPDYEARRDI